MFSDIKRANAQRIARQDQRLALGIPQRDSPLAVHPPECVFAPFLVSVDNDFGVAASAKGMTARGELFAQLEVIEDLAVERNPQCLSFVG